ncbi:uncharacterized protein LOC143295402 [Babylonia areolata]|uniref:uncharacterized protein LOC143295402 n=1 Tax=Babylonia areolata TaxID=304850 RepID=UPI003FD249BF
MKRGSDDEMEGSPSKLSRREEDDDGSKSGRSSRIRKKSAKVLEMEEFEEIEKKQFTSKKSDTKGKTPLSPTGLGGSKKGKTKGGVEDLLATVTSLQADSSLSGAMVLPGPSLTPEAGSVSPVKTSTKQAIGAKVNKGQGSVIKLLLSSPTIPTTPSVSTNVVTKSSPPVSISTTGASIISVPTPTLKKSTVKVKPELSLDIEQEDLIDEEELVGGMAVKTELMDPQAGHLMLATSLAPEASTSFQAVVKQEPSGTLTADSLSSLKLKLMMSPKDTPKMEPGIPTSGSLPIMSAVSSEKVDTRPISTLGTGSGGTAKKKAAPKKKKPSGEKASKQPGSKSAAEQMPNLAALVSTPKQLPKVVKEERTLSLSDGMDASLSDTSLDMSSIVESALDMEEEAALVIAEGNLAPSKPKKKRASGTGKKKSKAQAAAAAAMSLQGLDSDEGMSAPPEGDIAALAAKVQRSSAAAGGKKKMSKKSLEQQEAAAQDKKKRPSRRAPTAYMLYCNSQRPKVVAESPGIDFAQISRTLGVMWQCLSKKEKMMWRRKSKKLAGKGSTLISTGKGGKKDHSAASALQTSATHHPTPRPSASSKASKASASAVSPALAGEDTPQSPVKGFGIEPIDIAAHLKLLGESLSIIGNRLQEHKGLIAVQGSLSVLLDSMLCACGPLLALTHQVPGLDGCSESTHARTLDSVAYIMPGL